jgi:hypothetical protein
MGETMLAMVGWMVELTMVAVDIFRLLGRERSTCLYNRA